VFPWNGFLGLVLVFCCAAVVPAVERSAGRDHLPSDSPRLLVLKTGRVITGKIRDRDGGFDVFQTGSQLFIASETVWLVADDLREAHQKMRDSLPSLTPDDHIRLAQWCAANGLLGTARRELLDGLHKDPHREDARELLALVVRQQDAGRRKSSVPARSNLMDSIRAGYVPRGRSLGGLPAKLARDFARTVQPLISNKCASCHHPRANREFVVLSIRKGSTPEIAEQNLASVLSQINSGDPHSSPLLQSADATHGGAPAPLFRGRVGRRQLQTLTEWITTVALHAWPASVTAATSTDVESSAGRIVPTGHSQSMERDLSADAVPNPHGERRSIGQSDTHLLDDAARRNRLDRFDPAVFNQQFRNTTTTRQAAVTQHSRRN